ncbi:hypothetical protein B0T21DRAFT_372766 [Apiosordaria backusii]|uniref:Uncharacterized protein n=1 Tax=Apiosordaria backusii TaxID=314023 RepID=A0AA40E4Q6_9PEZI|nr:hypothetical protein B0T21DRAFT_372766 [Apiosordaria backusii]
MLRRFHHPVIIFGRSKMQRCRHPGLKSNSEMAYCAETETSTPQLLSKKFEMVVRKEKTEILCRYVLECPWLFGFCSPDADTLFVCFLNF